MNFLKKRISLFSTKIFIILLVALIVPTFFMFRYMNNKFEADIQQELSEKIIKSLAKSEDAIYQTFQGMANISTTIVLDEELLTALNSQEDYYRCTIAFDNALAALFANNLYAKLDVHVTMIDTKGFVYSNWELNYNDYSFLMEEKWIQKSIELPGHIVWELFSPGYIKNEEGKTYLSLARSVLSKGADGERLGSLIISIEQGQLSKILSGFSYTAKDSVYILAAEEDILLLKDYKEVFIEDAHIEKAATKAKTQNNGSFIDTYDEHKYLVSYYTLSSPWKYNGQQLMIMHYTDYESIDNELERISGQQNLLLIIFILVLIFVALVVSSQMVKPVRVLANAMGQSSSVSTDAKLDLKRKDEIGHLNRAFTSMLLRNKDLLQQVEYEYKVREKHQFESLRAQINPHFLFNTLNMIRWMALIRSADNIVESIDALATMLNFNMKRSGDLVSLEEELDNIRSYVFIQNARYAGRYKVKIQMDEELLHLKVIKFILQPIVENSILHAFNDEKGTIWIYGERDEKILKIYIEDNGVGVTRNVLHILNEEDKDKERVTGIGFSNVNERINIEYGEEYGVFIENLPEKGTLVTFTLPIIEDEGNSNAENNDEKDNDC